jgi:hypothetical protein
VIVRQHTKAAVSAESTRATRAAPATGGCTACAGKPTPVGEDQRLFELRGTSSTVNMGPVGLDDRLAKDERHRAGPTAKTRRSAGD